MQVPCTIHMKKLNPSEINMPKHKTILTGQNSSGTGVETWTGSGSAAFSWDDLDFALPLEPGLFLSLSS